MSESSWWTDQSIDLDEVDHDPVPWSPGADGLLRPGVRSLWWGARGSGKSLAAMTLAVDVCAAGGSVLYIDLENGRRRQSMRRNDILGSRPAEVRGLTRPPRLDYRDSFRFTVLSDEDKRKVWIERASEYELLVIDSAARVLGQLGAEENSNSDFARFMTEFVDPLGDGTAVLILDNTGWSDQARSRGASAKMDLTEVGYSVSGGGSCSPTVHGAITLKRQRSRDGDEWEVATLGAGGGDYGRFERGEAEKKNPREKVKEEILELLMAANLQTREGMKAADIARGIERKPTDKTVGRALDGLVEDGKIERGEDKVWRIVT